MEGKALALSNLKFYVGDLDTDTFDNLNNRISIRCFWHNPIWFISWKRLKIKSSLIIPVACIVGRGWRKERVREKRGLGSGERGEGTPAIKKPSE